MARLSETSGEAELWHAVMLRAFQDAKTNTQARKWLYSRDAEDVAELGGWDREAWLVFLERVNARGWDAPIKFKRAG